MSNLINRVMGEYPVSISTSLAFQGLFDKHPDSPKNKKKIGDFKQIWINIKTLYRNLHNAVEVKTEKIELTVIMDYVDILKAEMSAIDELMEKEGYDFVSLMITDIIVNSTELYVVGDKTLTIKTFGMQEGAETVFLPNVVSRKKQIVPQYTDMAK